MRDFLLFFQGDVLIVSSFLNAPPSPNSAAALAAWDAFICAQVRLCNAVLDPQGTHQLPLTLLWPSAPRQAAAIVNFIADVWKAQMHDAPHDPHRNPHHGPHHLRHGAFHHMKHRVKHVFEKLKEAVEHLLWPGQHAGHHHCKHAKSAARRYDSDRQPEHIVKVRFLQRR